MLLNDFFTHLPISSLAIWLNYCLICLPLCYLILLIVPRRFRQQPELLFIFFYALSIFIFIFGLIIALFLALFFFFQKPIARNKYPFANVDYPDYQHSPISKLTEYGEGSGFRIVTAKNESKLLRQKILVAINRFGNKSTNIINSIALTDDNDEIRLYAQSLIEKQDRELNARIKIFIEQLAKTEDIEAASYYKKQIAEVLWEQVYRYLVINENLTMTLQKIKIYALEAFEVLVSDVELPLLLAKIALHQSHLQEARDWLEIAVLNQAPDHKICSSLAEIDYLEKNYSQVADTLKLCQSKGIIGLDPVKSFWVGYD